MNLSVRKARMGDIRAIHALLMTSSADGLLLPRSLTDLYGHPVSYTHLTLPTKA